MAAKLRFLNPLEESSRCMMCHDAPCTAACGGKSDPAAFIRNVRFGMGEEALSAMAACTSCTEKRCERACIHYDFPIRISQIRAAVTPSAVSTRSPLKPDLSIDFCGIPCENPFFLSSSIVAGNYEMCARALDRGWGGIVYKTIGMGTIRELSPRFDVLNKERTSFVGFRNLEQISDRPLKDNLADLKRLKENYPSKVIVASIMGENEDEWTSLAADCEKAGVDIIECNFSCPHMSANGLGSDVGQNPDLVAAFTAAVRRGTRLPILAKMTPNLGSMVPPAKAALQNGADGIAAINTVKSFTGFNHQTLKALLDVTGKSAVSGYSGKAIKPIALRFISELKTYPSTAAAPLSGMGGIENWQDALDFLLMGCGNLQITTAVMQYGYRIIDPLKAGLAAFMNRNGFKKVSEIVGRGIGVFAPAGELDRETTVRPKIDGERCVSCGRCFVSCNDGGHQAVLWDTKKRMPKIDTSKCVGCHLCLYVCPSSAISAGERVQKVTDKV
ncbi:dihydroorotate oxidase [Treponema primitia ZAS-2]|uniref:dihydrouracil dehydrogenase (NAD(+)) n=1 Tax=Treponema primitia (strain ATCC BAA-887 / DSM 12427 / ZAS-2) TaxID=545694 RepID=F5YM79_TREPZ|nr:NAD-dependent dihydropyrimidine dehydrogenase subunit PreA [Treponema primitia]AEF85842.1 dihydroorotate oxidase [Treponema primitia ZAS-2]